MSTQASVPSTARHLLRNYATAMLLLALVVLFSLASPQFLTLGNIQSLLLVQTIVTLMTFGVMFPLIVGEFDLSVGNLIGFLAILGAYLAGRGNDWPVVAAAMVATGVIVGLINGLLTQAARISSFIATLATGIILLGFTQGLSGGQVLFSNIPKVIKQIGAG